MPAAAAGWGVLYAVVQVGWAATGTRVPWTEHSAYPAPLQLLLAALALLAGGAAPATIRALSRTARYAVGAVLAVAVPVLAIGATGLPIHLVTLLALAGPESATGLIQVLLDTAGAVLLLLVAVVYRRRMRGDCPRCGRRHTGGSDGPLAHPAAAPAARPTRRLAYLLLGGLLPWAGVKTVWTLGGDALGVSAADWRRTASAGATGLARTAAAAGIDVSVLAALLGAVLLAGLLHPWGQVFPRWTPFLAGRRVPRLLPLAPALLTGVPLTVYGAALTAIAPLIAVGVLPGITPTPPFTTASGVTWMVAFGGLAFTGLGLALLVAARSYAARTRPVCAVAAQG
ncbi:hypothetical protein [Kitasatospora cinereorecta]|uniref:Uncharacterized protein n=1 Tax=Kitasatospora cinereorecta TaxID=285560 RepID=A0ABW0VCD0_9ACTN